MVNALRYTLLSCFVTPFESDSSDGQPLAVPSGEQTQPACPLLGLNLGERHSVTKVKQASACVVEIHPAEKGQHEVFLGFADYAKNYLVFFRFGLVGDWSESGRQPRIDVTSELVISSKQGARYYRLREHVAQRRTRTSVSFHMDYPLLRAKQVAEFHLVVLSPALDVLLVHQRELFAVFSRYSAVVGTL